MSQFGDEFLRSTLGLTLGELAALRRISKHNTVCKGFESFISKKVWKIEMSCLIMCCVLLLVDFTSRLHLLRVRE